MQAVPGPPKITVDAIFGWRWPLSEEDQERIRWALGMLVIVRHTGICSGLEGTHCMI